MIIYGIKTWKCIAMPAVLFLGLSVFLFLQAVRMNLTIRDEVKEYGRITCFLNETEDADIPEQMISKEALQDESSLVYEIPINVQSSEISEEISVTGIKTYMIPGELISGRYYADQVSTPEMVMNKTALSDLMGDNSEKIRTMESWLGHTLIMGNCGVKICGIIDDGSETASVYISVPAAESYLTQQGEIPKASSYCVRISDLKTLIKTQEKMKDVGISTSVDDSKLFHWKLMEHGMKDLSIMGMIALAGFVSTIALSIKWNQQLETLRSMRVYAARVSMNLCVGSIIGVAAYMLATLWNV